METLALVAGFVIVFGGVGYVIFDMLKHFDKKKEMQH